MLSDDSSLRSLRLFRLFCLMTRSAPTLSSTFHQHCFPASFDNTFRLVARDGGGAVDIASASGTRRPGFESPQGIRFLGKHRSAVVHKMTLYALFVY
jgi:hypothetical protein